jgi:hypothetical protein
MQISLVFILDSPEEGSAKNQSARLTGVALMQLATLLDVFYCGWAEIHAQQLPNRAM